MQYLRKRRMKPGKQPHAACSKINTCLYKFQAYYRFV